MATLCKAAPLVPDTDYGELRIDGVSLHKTCWTIRDNSELFSSPPARGENPLVESLPGRPEAPIVPDQLACSLDMLVSGAVDPDGSPHSNPFTGLFSNRAALHAAIIQPMWDGATSLPYTFIFPGGHQVNGRIQPRELFSWVLLPNAIGRTILRVTFPSLDDFSAIQNPTFLGP